MSERIDPAVAASDIARIAGVGKAAVSNWRRRFADFPNPVGGTASSPTFGLADVEAWLRKHGREYEVSSAERVWQRARTVADDLTVGELLIGLGAYLLLGQRKPQLAAKLAATPPGKRTAALPSALSDAVPELPTQLPSRLPREWIGVFGEVAQLAEDDGAAAAFEGLCRRYVETFARRLAPTPPEIADLMANLVGASRGTVLDPACSTGNLLIPAHQSGATRLFGQDVDGAASGLTAVRLLLHGATVQVATGDSLRDDGFAEETTSAVVCNPPFGDRSWGNDDLAGDPRWQHGLPPRSESELAWAQHCFSHLKPGGLAAIVMPTSSASRQSGRRVRRNLIRAGALRAVIGLPSSTAVGTGSDIWLLRRPRDDEEPPASLLLVDGDADLATMREAWTRFDGDPTTELPKLSQAVRLVDLLDDEVDVSPSRRTTVEVSPKEIAKEFWPVRDQWGAFAAALRATMPALTPDLEGRAGQPSPMTTVDELTRSGLVAIHQAPLRMTSTEGDRPVLTAKDVRLGRPPSGRADPIPGTIELAEGDVVVPVGAKDLTVLVIGKGGALLGSQLLLLRANPDRLDPYFLAGYLRRMTVADSARASTSSTRNDTRRATVPLLPLEDQRKLGTAFRQLFEFEATVREAGMVADTMIRLGFAGLANGGLRPEDSV